MNGAKTSRTGVICTFLTNCLMMILWESNHVAVWSAIHLTEFRLTSLLDFSLLH